MINLLEKAYNCYLTLLDNANYGRVSQKYCTLKDAITYLKYGPENPRYEQYFYNNLRCPVKYKLDSSTEADQVISWTIDSDEIIQSDFSWTEIAASSNGTYSIITNSVSGFNFFYVSVPQGKKVIIYNELDIVLFNSTLADSSFQLFSGAGSITTSISTTNTVYKKKDIYNTYNPVLFKIKIY